MRKATLTRHTKVDEGTFGLWTSDSGFNCVTLERPVAGDFPCIPVGKYTCEMRDSEHFKNANYGYGLGRVYGVKDVPLRKDILIHPANFVQELKGCIAPGLKIEQMTNPATGELQTAVTYSRFAIGSLMKDMEGKPFELEIKEQFI